MKPTITNKLITLATLLGAFISLLTIHSCCPNGDCDEDPEFSGTVSGTVVDATETTKKLQGVLVELLQGTEVVTSTQTSSSGSFSLTVSNLKGAERFSVRASLDGYEDYTADQFEMNAGDNTEQVSINLMPLPKIRGTIRHQVTQAPLSNVSVALSPSDKTITTNEFGGYLFEKLEEGAYKISVSRSNFETQTINVQLASGEDKVQDINLVPLAPVLTVDKQSLDFGSTETTLPIILTNTGGDTIRWSVIESIAWASANPLSGTITTEPVTLNINVDRTGEVPGSYNQTMTISSNAGTFTITLTMTVQGAILQIIPSEISFGTSKSEESIQLKRIGWETLNYEIQSNRTWLTVSPSSGSIGNETDFITLTANRTSLTFGNYEAKLAFNTDNGTQVVTATITIPDPNAPQLTIEPLSVDFSSDAATKVLTLQNTGKGALNWSASKSTGWLTLSSSSGQISQGEKLNLTLSANRSTLTPGDYSDVVRFTGSGGDINVPVAMKVENKPVLSVNKQQLDFGRSHTTQTFTISNVGNGTMNWEVATNQSWITLHPTSGTNLGTVNVTVSRSGLSFGNYSGQVDIASDGGNGEVVVKMANQPPNAPPVANFTLSTTRANLNEEIYLDASGSTDDFDPTAALEVRWRFSSSGSFTAWTTEKTVSTSYNSQGIKTITLEVRDSEGVSSTAHKEVTIVENQPPNAVFTVAPGSGQVNTTTFQVNATGSSDDLDPSSELQVRWRWEDEQSFTAWSKTKTASHTYGSTGTKTITLEVLDSYGAVGSSTRSVEVTVDLTENEPNNSNSSANEIGQNATIIGTVGFNNDEVDWFKVIPDQNGLLSMRFVNTSAAGTQNADIDRIHIYNSEITWLSLFESNSSCDCFPPSTSATSAKISVSGDTPYYILIGRDAVHDAASYELQIYFEPIQQTDIGEPNNSNASAFEIGQNSTTVGTVGFNDDEVDWFKVIPDQNGLLSIRFTNTTLAGTQNADIDRIHIYNKDVTWLSFFESNASCDCFPPATVATSSKITVSRDEVYYFFVARDISLDAASYEIQVSFEQITHQDVGEPNNTSDAAFNLNFGVSNVALVGFDSDATDWYKVVPQANGSLTLVIENMHGPTANGSLDRVYLYNSGLTQLAYMESNASCDCFPPGTTSVSNKIPVSQNEIYFIKVSRKASIDAAPYRIEIKIE